MANKMKEEKGITLVELLATIVIFSIIAALAYSVLFQGYSNYQRTKVETELRDEADLIMASLISELFIAKKSEAVFSQSCKNGVVESYISKKNIPLSQTGFINKQVQIKGNAIQLTNNSISLVTNSCTGSASETLKPNISSTDGVHYNINFSLKTLKGKQNHSLEFNNTISIIND
ncbi:PulJ/GspJ family protein [Planococcus sp. YIM B11945]|uniref:PulJ/GspJ family protein n=1 Tax=Planococcus sp. YIM B11945 TaxID=3435410 RepID=UPI003D7D8BBA